MCHFIEITNWPRWGVMWSLAIAIYCAAKSLTWWTRTPADRVDRLKWAYLLAWPGMNVESLARDSSARPATAEWVFATFKTSVGVALLAFGTSVVGAWDCYMAGWIGMVGIVLVLHFGLFHLLSCAWRSYGYAAAPLMNWPIASESLSEFWGRRWNRAFRDLAHRFLFRPLHPVLGPSGALLAGFVASGLIHDVVVSLPAGGGYGLPTIYFALQGLGILLERSRFGRKLGLGRGLPGWTFCAVALLAPCGLLFHRPFVCDVIVPFLTALRSLT